MWASRHIYCSETEKWAQMKTTETKAPQNICTEWNGVWGGDHKSQRARKSEKRGAARAKIEMADRVTETAEEFSQNSQVWLAESETALKQRVEGEFISFCCGRMSWWTAAERVWAVKTKPGAGETAAEPRPLPGRGRGHGRRPWILPGHVHRETCRKKQRDRTHWSKPCDALVSHLSIEPKRRNK